MPIPEDNIVKPIYGKKEVQVKEAPTKIIPSEPQGKSEETEAEIKVPEEKEDAHGIGNDNGPREWQWNTSLPLHLQPLWTTARSVLGITMREAEMDENVVANIAYFAATITQSDNPKTIFKFLKNKMMEMPPNVGNPLYYLQRLLTFELEELKNLEGR